MLPYKVIACFCLLFCSYLVKVRGEGLFTGGDQETVQLGKVKLTVTLNGEGTPVYAVNFGDKPLVLPSRLGFVLKEDSAFYRGFVLRGVERRSVDATWQPVW